MVVDQITAVHVLPLVCRRWCQLHGFICFRTTDKTFDRATLEKLSCTMADVAAKFRHVRSLRFTDFSRVTQHCLSVIAKRCPNIVYLNCWNGGIDHLVTDADFKVVSSNCRALTRVSLSGCKGLTGAGISAVFGCTYLTHLNLNSTRFTGELGVSTCPSLTWLDLRYTNVTDVGLVFIADGCRALTHVSLKYCHNITDAGVAFICRLRLVDLDLSNTQFTGAGARPCPSLKTLRLSNTPITDAGVAVVVASFPALVDLDLSTTMIVAPSISLPALNRLQLAGCAFLTDDGVASIVASCPALTNLFLWRTTVTPGQRRLYPQCNIYQ